MFLFLNVKYIDDCIVHDDTFKYFLRNYLVIADFYIFLNFDEHN